MLSHVYIVKTFKDNEIEDKGSDPCLQRLHNLAGVSNVRTAVEQVITEGTSNVAEKAWKAGLMAPYRMNWEDSRHFRK
jgi:hypothetical protein